ncbi:PA2778 family cysteine peptidase [Pseudomonas sp. Gutcm_11s]|uniref:PA2778 family cysteine peptidase n=1 Tax=Pseudomonas sp. Gutcm_11s TaxID=3026088 RepID=UPI002361E1F4|nr:PA2778 family cysteine peptidase [Pseudomonas sp. Gutcm_11s]MDD0841807.1 PA2778 family cysteine peptidase [Pseudomonas sp. Gutcm_11s]
MPALTWAPLALAALMLLTGCAGQQLQLPASSERLPERVELADTPFFPQDDYQCGPAALATVLVQRGVQTSPESLLPSVYLPTRKGSLKVELVASARQYGQLVYPLQPNLDALLAQLAAGNPVLVMQNLGLDWYPQWHFAVAVGYDRERQELILRSARAKRWTTDFTAFDKTWARAGRWAVLTLPPDRLPAEPQLGSWMQAASDLEQTNQREAAATAYRTAQRQWPGESLPGFALANLLHATGDRAGAEQLLRDSLGRRGDFAAGWFNLSEMLNERGCVSQASAARACAQRLAPNDRRIDAPLSAAGKATGECQALPDCAVR